VDNFLSPYRLSIRARSGHGKRSACVGLNCSHERHAKIPESNDVQTKIRAKTATPHASAPLSARIRREVLAWFWVGLIFLLVNGTIGQARVIPSGSMENSLLIGDHLIISRVGYDAGLPFTNWHVPLWRNPKRQQIIIFRPPYAPNQTDLVKRAIGMPGDVVDLRDGNVWINGKQLEENYTLGPTKPAPPGYSQRGRINVEFPYRVPDKCYFALGDNRGNSYDSRFWGCVPREDLIGIPVMIYMSVDANPNTWQPGHIIDRFLAYANVLIHPATMRWKRIFHTFPS
jgi:signal peptidase I